jgi:hypothetical protein
MNRINDTPIPMVFDANTPPVKPKKKVIRKRLGTKERFIRIIQSQGNDIIKHWCNNKKNDDLYIEFEKVNADTDIFDVTRELYNEFVEYCFSDWGTGFDFYGDNDHDLPKEFDLTDFIELFNDCQEWFKDEYNINLLITDETFAWNNIVYWLVKVYDLFYTELNDLIEKKYNYYLDSKKTSRIACGICFENKILYTGCSCCNGNYICYQCYNCLDKKNTCPYCRCPEMIDSEPPQTAYSQDEITDKKELMIVLKRYTENPVMDKCEDCQCDIRYRDKSHYYIDDTGDVKVESLFCGDCFKKDR